MARFRFFTRPANVLAAVAGFSFSELRFSGTSQTCMLKIIGKQQEASSWDDVGIFIQGMHQCLKP